MFVCVCVCVCVFACVCVSVCVNVCVFVCVRVLSFQDENETYAKCHDVRVLKRAFGTA